MWLRLLVSLIAVQSLNANCGICQISNVACHSENTYSICINGTSIEDIITCPPNNVCCGEKLVCYPEASAKALCTPEPATTTAAPKETDPNVICANLGKAGIIKNENDPTCKSYIYCYKSGNGHIEGYEENCTKSKPYFNGKDCQAEKPDGCT